MAYSGKTRMWAWRQTRFVCITFSRSLHNALWKDSLLPLLLERGLVQAVSVPEKKPASGNKILRRRLDVADMEASAYGDNRREAVQQTYELLAKKSGIYCGFDPTADSLHIGHLLPLLVLLHFQRAGHPVVALVGGATAQLGDPSGREKDRHMMTVPMQVRENAEAIEGQLRQVFNNHLGIYSTEKSRALPPYRIVNNLDWYKEMSVTDFYSKIGSYVKAGDMLDRTVVKSRLNAGHGINFTEFVYQCFQAYDWLWLYEKHDCRIQLGGSDQLGNIEDGYAFIWKKLHYDAANQRPSLCGLTVPLMVSASGDKLGKMAGNAVWLSQSKPGCDRQLAAYLGQLGAADNVSLLKALTFIPVDVILAMDEDKARTTLLRYLEELLRGV